MHRSLSRALFLVPVALLTLASADVVAGVPKVGSGDASAGAWSIAARVKAAKGIDQADAVYDLWNHWDLDDPLAISAALAALSEDASLDPPVRTLATAFAATARLQLGDTTEAHALAMRAGYVDKWLVVGPFDHEGRAGFAPEIGPEIDRRGILSPTMTYDGKDHKGVHWRRLPIAASPYGIVDLAAAVRPSSHACVMATTFVNGSPVDDKNAKPVAASLWVGASGSVRVYWNGDRVLEDAAERGLTFDRVATSVTIAPGWNRLLVKVCGMDRSPSLTLRIADAKGAPLAGVRVDSDPRWAADAEGKGKTKDEKPAKGEPKKGDGKDAKKDAKKPPLPPIEVEAKDAKNPKKDDEKKPEKKGDFKAEKKDEKDKKLPLVLAEPFAQGTAKSYLQTLMARVAGDKGSAADLEQLARHLSETGGDDSTKHEARDLARRAAEMTPTAARWLLAGELAEDRNQRRGFVEKAAALAPNDVDVLYAQGLLAASGPNPDDALPFYERALKLAPDHLQSVVAHADLLASVGMRRIARGEIDKALGLRPRSRVLLERLARWTAIDAPNDADEIRLRWAELALTDGSYMVDRLDAAVRARDIEAARAVIGRWRALDPTGDAPVRDGAGAMEKLGDSAFAVGLLTAALEVAPDDPSITIALADVEGRRGKRDVQLKLYKQVLARWPQLTEIRDYLEQAEPSKPREDEMYAEAPEVFLKRRTLPALGFDTRILSEVSVTSVLPNGLSSRFKQIVFQPLTNEAVARAKQYAFGFQADIEAVTLRAAKIYREDGKVDEAAETGETSNNDPSISMYTSGRVYYVLFPNLRAGDVVELRYRIEDTTPRNAFGDYFGEVEYLQNAEPTARIEHVLRTPKGRELAIEMPASLKVAFNEEDKGDFHVRRWLAEMVPGTISEPSMPPWAETLAKVHVSTYKDWDALGSWYWGLVKDQYVADDAVRAKVKELTKGLTKNEDKVRAIYDWVVQQTRYVALEFGIHGFLPYRCSQIFARGFGDCKDKATLIVTMLKELNIEAVPVLVRTNTRGDIATQPPSLALFDHMIAYVPSLDLYLDGTAEDHGSTELPAMDRNALAVQIGQAIGQKAKIVHLPDPPASASVRTMVAELDLAKDLSASSVEASLEGTGTFAPRLRGRYRTTSPLEAKLHEDLPGDFSAIEWSSVVPSALEELEKTPSVKAKGKGPSFGKIDGDRRTLPVSTMGSLVAAWAPLSDRKLDLRFWSTQSIDDKFVYKLPANAKIARTPEAKKGTSPFGSYAVEVEVNKGVVKLHARFELAVTRVHAKDYAAFRAFLRDVDAALGQRLVISP